MPHGLTVPTPPYTPVPSPAGSAPCPSGHLPLEEAQAQVASALTMLLKAAVAPAGRKTGLAMHTQSRNSWDPAWKGEHRSAWAKDGCAQTGEDGPWPGWAVRGRVVSLAEHPDHREPVYSWGSCQPGPGPFKPLGRMTGNSFSAWPQLLTLSCLC